MLCSIELREEAQKILSLLCYASRPLSIDEVAEAFAVDIDDLESYIPESRFRGGPDDVLRICPGLVTVNLRNDGIQEVRIEHFSVQEYLFSDRIRSGRAAHFALSGPSQHGRMSKTCLLYLQHDVFLHQTLTPDLLKQYAFARYAAEFWYHHYRQADGQFTQQLTELVANLLTTRSIQERWVRLHKPDRPWDHQVDYDRFDEETPSAIYYASFLGLDEVLGFILSSSPADVNTQGGEYNTALQAASLGCSDKIVQLLLDVGANVDDLGGEYGTALQAASEGGHKRCRRYLSDHILSPKHRFGP
jgi:ankyrin repeat domain-containing protein 50